MSRRNQGGGGDVPPTPTPSVPSIRRRSDSSQKGNAQQISMSRSNSVTDEFGFPLATQQLRAPPHPHVHVTQTSDLQSVNRPRRLQQQPRGNAVHQRSQNKPSIQQHHSQQNLQAGPPPIMSRSNSASAIPKIPSKLSASASASSSSQRPPRSTTPSTSFHRQLSNQSSSSKSRSNTSSRSSGKVHPPHPKIKISKPDPTKYKNYTFQHPANAPRLTIRTIDVSHRIAFDTRIPSSSSSAALQKMLEEMDRVRGSRSTVGSNVVDDYYAKKKKTQRKSDNPCRISPSPNHMALLEFMHGGSSSSSRAGAAGRDARRPRVVRQLQWNAACSADADPWFDGYYEEDYLHSIEEEMKNASLNDTTTKTKQQPISKAKQKRQMRRKPKSTHGDGRYIPIDPLTTTKSMIPNHSPILTNIKRRLPMRSDVGFANPTPQEVQQKMNEVKKEAEWEEASPRIVLLASAFSLFNEDDDEMDELHPSCRSDAMVWAGGYIPGVPFAGRELVAAYKLNAKFYKKKKKKKLMKSDQQQQQHIDVERAKDPRSYSVFAPPVDATFSSTQLWRPRPFMDRPPGHVYFLACPLDIRFQGGDVEPLFCTMSLYSLSSSNGSNNKFCGKISEDFFFPAGDWNGIDGMDQGGSFDDDEEDDDDKQNQSWRRRKRRAIMSYDPLEVSVEDLYLVIQVFSASLPNETEEQNNMLGNQTEKKSIGRKIKKSLTRKPSSNSEKNDTTIESTMHSSSMNSQTSYEEVGAQYLTPVCFSIRQAFPHSSSNQRQETSPLFSFPETSESNEDFVKRLTSLVNMQQSTSGAKPIPIGGYADIYTSYLSKDFTRALLDEPPQLHSLLDDAAPLGPQLLADVMGDCAISFDGGPTSGGAVKKQRSKLRRLPPSHDSGYSSSFDLKEVLYFPPRSLPRKYEDDSSLCASTVLNLLYIYPRLIRCSSIKMLDGDEHLSLRIQVVEQELSSEMSLDSLDPTYQALHSIYNPTSPAGPPLVESFFTKVNRGNAGDKNTKKDGKGKGGRKEILLKDEVKVRLPNILDRRHFLRFSLFRMKNNAEIEPVAETAIPFIISSKESSSRGRVTTIVPNGLHRIQLSEEIQVHVETRIASSTHLNDPSIATLLRDYQIAPNDVKVGVGGDLASNSSLSDPIAVNSSSGFPSLDILTMAPGNSVRRHFQSLVSIIMLNFVNQNCPTFYFEALFDLFGSDSSWHRLVPWERMEPLIATVRSLFEILDKTRTSYQERDQSMLSLQYHRLIKSFLDAFDEALFTHHETDAENDDSELSESLSEKHFNDSLDSSYAFNDSIQYDEPSLNKTRIDRRKPKYQVTSPRNNINTRSFSRKAFVATRMDQMKAETEEDDDDDIYRREYFDDDETVVTLGTVTSRLETGSVFPVILETKSFTDGFQDEIVPTKSSTDAIQEETLLSCGSNSIVDTNTAEKPSRRSERSTPFSFASKRAEYMANRVNTMAQLVMAPCIAPSIDATISGGMNGSFSAANGPSPSNKSRITTRFGRNNNQNPFEPSSDAEEEGETKSVLPYLRGSQPCLKIPPLVFHLLTEYTDSTASGTPFLYEIVVTLWVQAWTSSAASMKSDIQIQGSTHNIPSWPFELVVGDVGQSTDCNVARAFVRHMAFFLPLCLKSLGLRCASSPTTKLIVPMTFLDESHMLILAPMLETIAIGLMRESLSGSSGVANSDQMLTKSLSNSDYVLDFIVGLFALLHPSQVATLLRAYFNILEECEGPSLKYRNTPHTAKKSSELRRIRCARQLRLHAVERLVTMPNFSRLNFPIKFTGSYPRMKDTSSPTETDVLEKYWEKVDRFPHCFWISEYLMNQCLLICTSSCEQIIVEAKKQAKAAKQGKRGDDAMSREDLLRLESLAFHSILCAYELLIKRQSTDSRFQTIALNTRVAGLFSRAFLQKSVDAAVFLARMDPDQKVRMIWLLCVLYVLQEGPDAIIRNELRRFCNPKDNRINDFVHLLKLASVSCQHFVPGDVSLPVLGDLSKEMTQEAFNGLAASVILLIDECFDIVSEDAHELDRLCESTFDVLLHILSTPQSSVTLLRTLGSSAHALDKFGVHIFLKMVGEDLQHWSRIVLTLCNSTELSVRSMAVDFLVSLLADAYQAQESIGLCILSVLPEIVAREIALYAVSGLIRSNEDAESALWPLRRALADVEETNPLDDDRVDPEMIPSLTTMCRAAQAIIDGVLVEIRLKGSSDFDLDEITKAQCCSSAASFHQARRLPFTCLFDADEESVFEAATFFSYDTGLMQKLRWLYTLRDLHIAKRQWSEVAECLVLCAHALIKSLDNFPNLWRPSKFELWNDYRRSPWLSSVGLSDEQSSQGNVAVMKFANAFFEPGVLVQPEGQDTAHNHLTVESVCSTLTGIIDQIETAYAEEDGLDDSACSNLEELLNMITVTITNESKTYHSQEWEAMKRVRANICSKLAKLTDRGDEKGFLASRDEGGRGQGQFVQVVLHGNKPDRFKESTTIPTFFEWDAPSICRVPLAALTAAAQIRRQIPSESWEECICRAYAQPLLDALRHNGAGAGHLIELRTRVSQSSAADETKTYMSVMCVQKKSSMKSRKFFMRYGQDEITEFTVAHKFPHALSRQRALMSSEIKLSAGDK